MEEIMKKVLYASVAISLLAGVGIANAQFADRRPPPQINFSRSPRTMAEEALNESRRNRPTPPTAFVADEVSVQEESKEEQTNSAPLVEAQESQAQTQPEYEEVIKIPRKKRDIFDIIDSNQDGFISKEEYDVFAQERTNKIFKDMDSQNNGMITREAFMEYRRQKR